MAQQHVVCANVVTYTASRNPGVTHIDLHPVSFPEIQLLGAGGGGEAGTLESPRSLYISSSLSQWNRSHQSAQNSPFSCGSCTGMSIKEYVIKGEGEVGHQPWVPNWEDVKIAAPDAAFCTTPS